jgi:GntR family transcriptional regulator/MocR family aminotransferase
MTTRKQEFALSLPEDKAGATLTLRIAGALARAIRTGRLKPGEPLPGSRALAESLGVHRNTVLAAIKELEAEGWVESRQGSGTFVCDPLPHLTPQAWGRTQAWRMKPAQDPGFTLPAPMGPASLVNAAALELGEPWPLTAHFPAEAFGRACQRGLRLHAEALLGPGDPRGPRLLRETLAGWLSEKQGFALTEDRLTLTGGGRHGLGLVLRVLFPSGGVIAVEDPGRFRAWDVMRSLPQLKLVPIPVDGEGLCVDDLERAIPRESIDAVYLTPSSQVPTGVPLSPERRQRLLALARLHRLALIEDHSEALLRLESVPLPPLAAEDPSGQVICLGSLSRLLSPGLGLGFLIAPESLLKRVTELRRRWEGETPGLAAWALGDLWREGEVERTLRRSAQACRTVRDELARRLTLDLGDQIRLHASAAGASLWITSARSGEAWARRARAQGLMIHAGKRFSFREEDLPAIRVGLGRLCEEDVARAIQGLVQSFPDAVV